jgi:hypothetical protein
MLGNLSSFEEIKEAFSSLEVFWGVLTLESSEFNFIIEGLLTIPFIPFAGVFRDTSKAN